MQQQKVNYILTLLKTTCAFLYITVTADSERNLRSHVKHASSISMTFYFVFFKFGLNNTHFLSRYFQAPTWSLDRYVSEQK